MNNLSGKKVAIITENGFEEVELTKFVNPPPVSNQPDVKISRFQLQIGGHAIKNKNTNR